MRCRVERDTEQENARGDKQDTVVVGFEFVHGVVGYFCGAEAATETEASRNFTVSVSWPKSTGICAV